jgi:predicted MFS family arabinose efflux permease
MTATTTTAERNGPLSPLRIPGFKILAGGYSINELGNWLGDIALAVLVFDQTGSALATALLFCGTRFVPALVSPLVVARVESLPPRRSLPLLYGLDAIVFAVLAVLAGGDFSLVLIVVLGAADGTLALAARAVGRSTTGALLAPHGLLRQGNAIFNIGFTGAGALGPAIAGLVVAHAGVQAALWADAASFALVAVALGMSRSLPARERAEGDWIVRLRAGLVYVRGRKLLFGLLAAQAALSLCFFAVVPVEVVYAKETLGGGDAAYGWLLASWGAGMIAGGVLFASLTRVRMRTMLVASTLAISLSYLGLAAAPSLGAAYAIAVLGGLGNGIQWVSVVTAVQELTEQGMQARVLGLLEATATALPGIGFFAGGALAALASPRAVYLAASAGGLIVLAVSAVKLRTAVWPDRPAVSADEVALPGHVPVADWD